MRSRNKTEMELKTGMHNSILKRRRSRLLVSRDISIRPHFTKVKWLSVATRRLFQKINTTLGMNISSLHDTASRDPLPLKVALFSSLLFSCWSRGKKRCRRQRGMRLLARQWPGRGRRRYLSLIGAFRSWLPWQTKSLDYCA